MKVRSQRTANRISTTTVGLINNQTLPGDLFATGNFGGKIPVDIGVLITDDIEQRYALYDTGICKIYYY